MRSRFTTRRENRSFLGQLDRSLPAPHTRRTSSTGIAYSGGLRSAMTAGHTLKPFIASRHRPDASARVRRDECMPGPPRTSEGEGPVYREIFVPFDHPTHSDWAVDRAIELSRRSDGRITGNHVYAARLHDVRFRQLETGLPARFQTPAEIKKQRKIHDKLIEKGLQLIADSFLDQLGKRCEAAGVRLTRQLLEGINYEEIVSEVNRGAGRLPGLIGFDPDRAAGYDGGEKVRSDVKVGENNRLVAEDEDTAARLAGSSGRQYDLLAIGAHGLGRQPYSQLGGVVSRVLRGIAKDVLLVRDDRPFAGGRFLVCVDGSSYSYRAMRVALELAQASGGSLYVCSAFDVEYHHVVFHNIKDVLSYQASKVFKFEEQEELHNNIIDKGLLKLCQANLKRAEVMAREFPDVPLKTQILIGKPFQVIMQWAEEITPSLLVLAQTHGEPATVTNKWLDEAIRKLLPTHMQLIMGIGTAEEIALAEVKAREQMKATKVLGHDADPQALTPDVEVRCPVTGSVSTRPRVATDPIVWTEEAWARLQLVPLIARPLARNTVERFARGHDIWRVTTAVMDDNKQAMIAADEFDIETMMVMFTELRAKQIRAGAEGTDALSPEMRAFIEEAKAQGITRCPIRDIEAKMGKCPVEFKGMTPQEAKEAIERVLEEQAGD